MTDCESCGLPLASTGQIEGGKLLYACDNGHPALMEVETLAQAREVAEILTTQTLVKMRETIPTSTFTMAWVTPTKLASFENGSEYCCLDISTAI
jgi:hypothetical protein